MVWRARGLGTWLGFLVLGGCSGVTPGELTFRSERGDIVGGMEDSTHKGVFGMVIQNRSICSGSLIAPNLVLTARHCVSALSTGGDQVNCGETNFDPPYDASEFALTWAQNLNQTVPQNSVYGATEVRVASGTNDVCGNDVALLILDANVPSGDAALIEPRVDEAPETPEAFSAIGYGLNDPDDTSGASAGVRRMASGLKVGCVGAAECDGAQASDSEWAAYTPVCSGDSGGPALDAQGRVIGVASRADANCEVALYGSVSSFKALIIDAAIDAADQGGYDPPDWTGMGPVDPMDGGVPDAGTPDAGSAGGSGGRGGGGSGGSSGRTGSGGTSGGSGGSGATAGSGSAGRGSAGQAQMPMDGGAPLPDSGVPNDAGVPSQLEPGLGDECTDFCSGDLLCYSASGKPPGECVPACSSSKQACPGELECNEGIGVCIPRDDGADDEDKDHSSGCGCRVAGPPSHGTWGVLGLFAALGGVIRRRSRR
jgi:MYXO-CTERM domain-containing protein